MRGDAHTRRLCRKHAAEPTTPTEPTTETDTPLAIYADEADAEEKFAAWEMERSEKLRKATEHEQHGLRFLAQAALLRASVKCEDRGESFIAEELRELAADTPLPEPVPATAWDRPALRIFGADEPVNRCVEEPPLNRGA